MTIVLQISKAIYATPAPLKAAVVLDSSLRTMATFNFPSASVTSLQLSSTPHTASSGSTLASATIQPPLAPNVVQDDHDLIKENRAILAFIIVLGVMASVILLSTIGCVWYQRKKEKCTICIERGKYDDHRQQATADKLHGSEGTPSVDPTTARALLGQDNAAIHGRHEEPVLALQAEYQEQAKDNYQHRESSVDPSLSFFAVSNSAPRQPGRSLTSTGASAQPLRPKYTLRPSFFSLSGYSDTTPINTEQLCTRESRARSCHQPAQTQSVAAHARSKSTDTSWEKQEMRGGTEPLVFPQQRPDGFF